MNDVNAGVGLSDGDLDFDFGGVLDGHEPDYGSIGGCTCGGSYPCTTMALVSELQRARADRDRLADAIRTHRDWIFQECGEESTNEADERLYAALDEEDDR